MLSGITDHYCVMENFFKKLGKNKNKLRRIIYPKIIKILRAASLVSNFTGSYKKECNAN